MEKPARKLAALLLAVLLCLALAACKRSDVATGFGKVADWGPAQTPKEAETSDITTLDSPAFGPYTGFDLTAWPSDDDLQPRQFFAIDGWLAQMEYHTADDRLLVVRIAAAGGKTLTSTYTEGHHVDRQTLAVDEIEVALAAGAKGCHIATWARGDFQYLVHSNSLQDAPPAGEIEALVRGLLAEAVEGAASPASQSGGA